MMGPKLKYVFFVFLVLLIHCGGSSDSSSEIDQSPNSSESEIFPSISFNQSLLPDYIQSLGVENLEAQAYLNQKEINQTIKVNKSGNFIFNIPSNSEEYQLDIYINLIAPQFSDKTSLFQYFISHAHAKSKKNTIIHISKTKTKKQPIKVASLDIKVVDKFSEKVAFVREEVCLEALRRMENEEEVPERVRKFCGIKEIINQPTTPVEDDPFACGDSDNDGCDDCSIFEPRDFDGDGLCNQGDSDQDNDGSLNEDDRWDNDPTVCSDEDEDGCEDCSSGRFDLNNDGLDTDGDGICDDGHPLIDDDGDPDKDNDGVLNEEDIAPLDRNRCKDEDRDGCDECSSGSVVDINEDGVDSDSDGLCDVGDPDRDGDGVNNEEDSDPDFRFICQDLDSDGCDECFSGELVELNEDGPDHDGDGLCNLGDPDDDNDNVNDDEDPNDRDNNVCGDSDGDNCDDCSERGVRNPRFDGLDTDGDGLCNLGDLDDDGDGVEDIRDPSPLWSSLCGDSDNDGCGDCLIEGHKNPENDGPDFDGDGQCDGGDGDDDNDYVGDAADTDPFNRYVCGDRDGDGCEDCGIEGAFATDNDGPDQDGDGLCDSGDLDDDNDGSLDEVDQFPNDGTRCGDSDRDSCDDCSDEENEDSDQDGICDRGDRQQIVNNGDGPINYGLEFLSRLRIQGILVDYELMDVNGDGLEDIVYLENVIDENSGNVAPRVRIDGASALNGYGEDEAVRIRINNESCGYAPFHQRSKSNSYINIVFAQVGENLEIQYDVNPVILAAGNFATDLIIEDINQDGLLDLMTLNNDRHIKENDELIGESILHVCYPFYGSTNVFLRENQNQNFYQSRQTQEVAGCPVSGTFHDVNADGSKDLYVASNCRRFSSGSDRTDGYAQDHVRIYTRENNPERLFSDIENSQVVYDAHFMQSRSFTNIPGQLVGGIQADFQDNRSGIFQDDFKNPIEIKIEDYLGDGTVEVGIVQDHNGYRKYRPTFANINPLKLTLLKHSPEDINHYRVGEYSYLRTNRLDRGWGTYPGFQLRDLNGDNRLDYVLSSSSGVYFIPQDGLRDYQYPTTNWSSFSPRTSQISDLLLDTASSISDVELRDFNRDGHVDMFVSLSSTDVHFRREISEKAVAMLIFGDENGLVTGDFRIQYRENENNFRDRVIIYTLPENLNFSRAELNSTSNVGKYHDIRVKDINRDGLLDISLVGRFESREVVEENAEGVLEPVQAGFDGYTFLILKGMRAGAGDQIRQESLNDLKAIGANIDYSQVIDLDMENEIGSTINAEDYPLAQVMKEMKDEIILARIEGREPRFDNLTLQEIYQNLLEDYANDVRDINSQDFTCFEIQEGEEIRGFEVWYRMMTECWFNEELYGEDPGQNPLPGGGAGGDRPNDEVLSIEEFLGEAIYDDYSNEGVLLEVLEAQLDEPARNHVIDKLPVEHNASEVSPENSVLNRVAVTIDPDTTVRRLNQVLQENNMLIAAMNRDRLALTLEIPLQNSNQRLVQFISNLKENYDDVFLKVTRALIGEANMDPRGGEGTAAEHWKNPLVMGMHPTWNGSKAPIERNCNDIKDKVIFFSIDLFGERGTLYLKERFPNIIEGRKRAAGTAALDTDVHFHGTTSALYMAGGLSEDAYNLGIIGTHPAAQCVTFVTYEALASRDEADTTILSFPDLIKGAGHVLNKIQERYPNSKIIINNSIGYTTRLDSMPTMSEWLDYLYDYMDIWRVSVRDNNQGLLNNANTVITSSGGNRLSDDNYPQEIFHAKYNSFTSALAYESLLDYVNSDTLQDNSLGRLTLSNVEKRVFIERLASGREGLISIAELSTTLSNTVVVGGAYADIDLSDENNPTVTYRVEEEYFPGTHVQGLSRDLFDVRGNGSTTRGTSFTSPMVAGGVATIWSTIAAFENEDKNPRQLNSHEIIDLIKHPDLTLPYFPNSFGLYQHPQTQEVISLEINLAPEIVFPNFYEVALEIDQRRVENLTVLNAPFRHAIMDFDENGRFDENDISLALQPGNIISGNAGSIIGVCNRFDIGADCTLAPFNNDRRQRFDANRDGYISDVDLNDHRDIIQNQDRHGLFELYNHVYMTPIGMSVGDERFNNFDLLVYYAYQGESPMRLEDGRSQNFYNQAYQNPGIYEGSLRARHELLVDNSNYTGIVQDFFLNRETPVSIIDKIKDVHYGPVPISTETLGVFCPNLPMNNMEGWWCDHSFDDNM